MHKKRLKTSPKNDIKLTKFVHIEQMDSNRIRNLLTFCEVKYGYRKEI